MRVDGCGVEKEPDEKLYLLRILAHKCNAVFTLNSTIKTP